MLIINVRHKVSLHVLTLNAKYGKDISCPHYLLCKSTQTMQVLFTDI